LPPLTLRTFVNTFNKGAFRKEISLVLGDWDQQTDEELVWLVDFLVKAVPKWED